MPLSGSLFDFGRFTPMYGTGALATRALQKDIVYTTAGDVREALWVPVANIAVWTLIFVVACLAARRRTTRR